MPVVTFLSAYRITDRVSQGAQWEEKGYFLSAMIDLQPAANIGSLGLTLSLGSFLVVAFVRHKIVKKQLGAQRCVLLHRASITLAFIAAIGGDGVAAYQHSASRTVTTSSPRRSCSARSRTSASSASSSGAARSRRSACASSTRRCAR